MLISKSMKSRRYLIAQDSVYVLSTNAAFTNAVFTWSCAKGPTSYCPNDLTPNFVNSF